MKRDAIVVLDFGSQYTQLIARRIREQQVYCEIEPYTIPIADIEKIAPKGIILSGGPASVYEDDSPKIDAEFLRLGIPVLGICYGMQLIAFLLKGGKVHPASEREYGNAQLQVSSTNTEPLFAGLSSEVTAWMSHGDRIDRLPDGFHTIAQTSNSPIAAMVNSDQMVYGLQFHPEVEHTRDSDKILYNFVRKICGCEANWTMDTFITEAITHIRATVKDERVLCAVSGGVDSMVLATLLHEAIGDASVSVFVDNGLLRHNEVEQVLATSKTLGLNLEFVDATDSFLNALEGVVNPEQKRKIIGAQFIETFIAKVKQLGPCRFLAQGTLYPDVIESVSTKGPSATIKTHHNVGGLPPDMPFDLIEPFRELFKDEVRAVGAELKIPSHVLGRHPFPGPGLAVRILGEVTPEQLEVLRLADAIFINEIKNAGLYDDIWQALAVLLPVKSVGVMGDERTYENAIALRAVTSSDAMTADWARIPNDVLAKISTRIINEVQGINRVVYDISSKPPSTIEWE